MIHLWHCHLCNEFFEVEGAPQKKVIRCPECLKWEAHYVNPDRMVADEAR